MLSCTPFTHSVYSVLFMVYHFVESLFVKKIQLGVSDETSNRQDGIGVTVTTGHLVRSQSEALEWPGMVFSYFTVDPYEWILGPLFGHVKHRWRRVSAIEVI